MNRSRTGNLGLAVLCSYALLLMSGCETTTTVSSAPVSSASGDGPTVDPDGAKRAGIRLKLASSYYQNRQLNVAIEEANRAIQIDPSLAAAYGLLGLIYMDQGDRQLAESNFQRALRLEPENPELLNNYGWYLCQTGRERLSLEQFQRAAAIRRYATPGMALQNAGVCLLQVGDLDEAERTFRRAFELDAGNPITQFHLARLNLRAGRVERAAFYYDILQRRVEPAPEVIFLGLRLARAQGDVRTERQLADDLARRFPNSPEAERLQRGQFNE